MQKNFVKEKLATGAPVFGTWSIVHSPIVSEIIASAGLDFQILDMEHGTFDIGSLESSIRACESNQCSPIVRVPEVNSTTVQKCLDLGAHGMIFPQVKSAATARDAAATLLYGPQGVRGFNPFTRAGNYGGMITDKTPKLKNGFALTSLIIENQGAYQELDQILAIESLDMVYLGVYDMSVALGCPGNFSDPALVKFVADALPRIRRAGKAAGVMVKSQAEMRKYLDLGANFFLYAVDSYVIRQAFEKAVTEFKEALIK